MRKARISAIRQLPCILLIAGFIQSPTVLAEEYFDSENPPTKEQLLQILKLPEDHIVHAQSMGWQTRGTGWQTKLNKTQSFCSINIPFGNNSTNLNEEAEQLLELIGSAMRSLPDQNFIVEGHTDSKGSYVYNLQLSESRAKSARSFLVEEYKIPPSKIKAVGKGESDPIDPYDPASERNRSVRIITYR